MTDAVPVQKPRREYRTSGLYTLKRAVNVLGGRYIDRRYSVGKALAKWKADITTDLGGDLSTQQKEIIDLAAKTKLLLDSIDAWLLTQNSLVNARKRALLPVVRERQTLADSLAKYLTMLGLERKPKQIRDIMDALEQDQGAETEQQEAEKVPEPGKSEEPE